MNTDKYLTNDYRVNGSILKLRDETEFYASGSSKAKNAVILIPDTNGWNSGRIRNIADFFGDNGTYSIVPKLMGGSKGSSGESVSFFDSSGLGDYMKSQIFDGNLKPKIGSIVNYLKSEGVEKIGLVGFSWGGWVALNLLATNIADEFVCAVLPHASINLEERLYGGSLVQLISKVQRPVLLMPARGDPEDYTAFINLLKFKFPTSGVIDYHDVEHNFLLRGRAEDRDIKHACQKALCEIHCFLQHHFEMNIADITKNTSEGSLGQEANVKRDDRNWAEYTKDKLSDTTKRFGQATEKAGQRIEDSGSEYQRQEGQRRAQEV